MALSLLPLSSLSSPLGPSFRFSQTKTEPENIPTQEFIPFTKASLVWCLSIHFPKAVVEKVQERGLIRKKLSI